MEKDTIENIEIRGDVGALDVGRCNRINVSGNAKKVKSTFGDIEINGNVEGDVKSTSGDVECQDVGGSVETTSGEIRCGNIKGSVETMSGDIRHK